MAIDLDLSRRPGSPAQAASLARVRAAARAELLARPAGRGFRGDVLALLSTTALLTLAAAAVTWSGGSWALATASQRGLTLLLLALVQVVGATAALRPRARTAQLAAVGLAAVAMAALVLARGAGAPSTVPHWVCGASHFALSLGPVGLALVLLRRSRPSALKALAAGASAATIGAALGELVCGRDALHVALFHVPAFLAAMALTFFLSRRLRPHSFAD